VRSRVEQQLVALALLLLAAAAATGEQAGSPPTPAEIDAAVAQGRADPALGVEKKSKRLHWIGADTPKSPPKTSEPQGWLVNLFEFLGQTASLVLWVLGFIAAGILGVWVYRVARARSPRVAPVGRVDRSQIGDLDIRPVSLPDDVGAAARELLDAGHTRDALSLLYRGALSRAVHRHGIAIGAAATEGEVLRAVDGRLDAASVDYVRTLVQLWQRAVYAGVPTAPEAVRPLCARFVGALG
jgi:hypothetical protein